MKKLISIFVILALIFQPLAFSAWDDTAPAGTSNVSDIDANVIANNQAAESTLSGLTGWTNLKITAGGSATAVTVTADMLLLQASANIATRITSVSESIAITTSGASGLVSSLSEAANTIYYVWIARKSSDSTVNGYLSTTTSLTTFLTQVDSGYDQAALVSVVGNDGSSNFIDFIQQGREYWFTTWLSIASGTVSAWTVIDLTPSTLSFFVPTNLSTVAFGAFSGGSSAVVSNRNTGATTIATVDGSGIYYLNQSGYWRLNVVTTDTIYWGSNQSSIIWLAGFELNKL